MRAVLSPGQWETVRGPPGGERLRPRDLLA